MDRPPAPLFRIVFALLCTYVAASMAATLYAGLTGEVPAIAYAKDSSVFWAAAKLAWLEGPRAVFDQAALNEMRQLPPDAPPAARHMAWLYPPHFLALLLPLAAVPQLVAWALFGLFGLALFWLGLRRLLPRHPLRGLVWMSPATVVCVLQGQNSLLVAGLLALFLADLRDGRPSRAGLSLGALTIKPQFGPLLVVAMAAGRRLATLAVAALVAGALLGAATIWAGTGFWSDLLEVFARLRADVDGGEQPRHLMVTWYAFTIAWGLPRGAAPWVQGLATAAMAALVFAAWHRRGGPVEAKGALLAFAAPLATPYAYYYDLTLAMVGLAALLALPGERSRPVGLLLLGLWLFPGLAALAYPLGYQWGFALFGAPLLTAAALAAALAALSGGAAEGAPGKRAPGRPEGPSGAGRPQVSACGRLAN